MAYKQCDSDIQSEFNGEIVIHYPGLKGLDKPIVMVFRKRLGLFALWLHGVHRSRKRIGAP